MEEDTYLVMWKENTIGKSFDDEAEYPLPSQKRFIKCFGASFMRHAGIPEAGSPDSVINMTVSGK